jgi:hypothetical protein
VIKSTKDQIYNRLKNNVGFHRSKKFKDWFHQKYPGKQMHHVFGSVSQSLKTSDYCSVPVSHEEHERAEKNKSDFAIDNLPVVFNVLQDYIRDLEAKK